MIHNSRNPNAESLPDHERALYTVDEMLKFFERAKLSVTQRRPSCSNRPVTIGSA
jgi:hypothetical protein